MTTILVSRILAHRNTRQSSTWTKSLCDIKSMMSRLSTSLPSSPIAFAGQLRKYHPHQGYHELDLSPPWGSAVLAKAWLVVPELRNLQKRRWIIKWADSTMGLLLDVAPTVTVATKAKPNTGGHYKRKSNMEDLGPSKSCRAYTAVDLEWSRCQRRKRKRNEHISIGIISDSAAFSKDVNWANNHLL